MEGPHGDDFWKRKTKATQAVVLQVRGSARLKRIRRIGGLVREQLRSGVKEAKDGEIN